MLISQFAKYDRVLRTLILNPRYNILHLNNPADKYFPPYKNQSCTFYCATLLIWSLIS